MRFRIADCRFVRFRPVFQDSFTHTQAVKRLAKIVLHFAQHIAFGVFGGVCDDRSTQNIFCQCTQHVFCQVHQIIVISISLVELQHGEFRVVARRQTFVSEVTVDFEHALKTTYYKALQIQFRGDTQIHIDIQ